LRAVSVPGTDEELDVVSCRGACAKRLFRFRRLTQPPLQPGFNEMIVQNQLSRHSLGAMHPRIVGRLCQTPAYPNVAFDTNALQKRSKRAFTLIELLVVIAIIGILVGLLFPAFKAVQDQAKRTQAKNDLTQIVNAVNAFYTEYGKYPISTIVDTTFGPGGSPTNNENLFRELRACAVPLPGSCATAAVLNTRQVVFISPPDVKDPANPRSGIGTATANKGQYFDPWSTNYVIRIDGDYNNQVANPYSANAGAIPNLQIGVIALSLGKDQLGGIGSADKNAGNADDDVISWQ
jgi:prepilin-type N-terminal cleavage/methylation domain-containing protein